MKFTSQSIPDVILIEPTIHGDDRGYFVETFRQDLFEEANGHKVNFVQENESKSSYGVLRGLHFQKSPCAQSKLVRVIEGEVLDVAVDLRKKSETFGEFIAIKLSGVNKKQLFIPKGFAHGYVVLSEFATFSYKVDEYYNPDEEGGIKFNDDLLSIDWIIPNEDIILSSKDKDNCSISTSYYFD